MKSIVVCQITSEEQPDKAVFVEVSLPDNQLLPKESIVVFNAPEGPPFFVTMNVYFCLKDVNVADAKVVLKTEKDVQTTVIWLKENTRAQELTPGMLPRILQPQVVQTSSETSPGDPSLESPSE